GNHVGLGALGQQHAVAVLVGRRAVRAALDLDHAAVDGLGRVGGDAAGIGIGGGVADQMVGGQGLVEMLGAVAIVDAPDVGFGALADQVGLHVDLAEIAAE